MDTFYADYARACARLGVTARPQVLDAAREADRAGYARRGAGG